MSDYLVVDTNDLGQIKIPFHRVELDIRHDDNREEHHSLRIFLPAQVSGLEFGDYMINLFSDWADQAEADGDPYYRDQLRLVWLDSVFPNKDRRRIRKFDSRTFEKCETLRSLLEYTKTRHATTLERINACLKGDDATNCYGLEALLYNVPAIRLPVGEDEYLEFREHLLEEIGSFRESLQKLMYETLKTTARQKLKDVGLKRISRKRIEKAIEEWENGEGWERTLPAVKKFFSRVLARIVKQEKQIEMRFQDLVARVDQLQELLEDEVERQGIRVRYDNDEGEIVYTQEFVGLLENTILPEADEVLEQLRLRIEHDHELPPVEFVEIEEFGEFESYTENDQPIPELTVYQQYQSNLALACSTDDALFKWSVLCQMRSQLVNRTECMRLLQREAELAAATTFGVAAHEIYRRIRKQLSPPERRLFKLLHFPNRLLGGRVALLERVAWTFATELDEETTVQLFSVLVLKFESCPAQEQLLSRWENFLRFYPFWRECVRADEREKCRMRCKGPKEEWIHPDTIPDWREYPQDIAVKFAAFTRHSLPDLATRLCTPTQAKYLVAFFQDRRSEQEIAREYRVTQQAVNKGIKAGVSRLISAIECEELLESNA